jgi:O-antigen/teichoic acid export membrane protein
LFARALGAADFGRFSVAITVLRLVGGVAPLGVPRAAVVFGSAAWPDDAGRLRGVVRDTITASLVVSGLLALGLWLAADWVAQDFFRNAVGSGLIRIVAYAIPFVVLTYLFAALSRVPQRTLWGVLVEDIAQPAAAILFFSVALLGISGRLEAAMWATIVSFGLAAVVGAYATYRGLLRDLEQVPARTSDYRRLLSFCAPVAVGLLCSTVSNLADRVVVGRMFEAEAMAAYQAAAQLALSLSLIVTAFGSILAPMASGFLARNDLENVQRIHAVTIKWGLWLCVPAWAALCATGEQLLGLVFGPEFRQGHVALAVLATGQLVNVSTGGVGLILVSAGLRHEWMVLAMASAILGPGLAIFLAPKVGLAGPAVANLVAMIVLFGGATGVVQWRLAIWPYAREHLEILAVGVVGLAGSVFAVNIMAGHGDAISCLVGGLVPAGISGVYLWRSGLDPVELGVLRRTWVNRHKLSRP